MRIRIFIICMMAVAPISVLADSAGFGLRGVDLSLAGNTGPVSFMIYGSSLDNDTAYEVIDAGGMHFSATKAVRINEWRAIATFNLSGASEGMARVAAAKGTLQAHLENALTISDGLTGQLETKLDTTPEIKAGQVTPIYVSYANTGHTDIDLPLLVLTVHGAGYLGMKPTGNNMGEHAFILGIPDGPIYTALRPGERVTIPFYVRLDTPCTVGAMLSIIDLNDSSLFATPFDYDSLAAMTPNPSSPAVQTLIDEMAADYGPNLGTFYASELENLAQMVQINANGYASAKHVNGRWIMEPAAEPRLTRSLPPNPDVEISALPPVTPPVNTGGDGIVQTYAIIIGITDYDNYGEDGDLKGTVTNAKLMYNHFRHQQRVPESHIQLFLDDSDDPTDSVTNEMLHNAIQNCNADGDDHLVIYFAGHSTYLDAIGGVEFEPTGLMGGLCMSDVAIDSGMVNERELSNWITQKNAGNTYIILDCCHSGGFTDGIFQAPRTAVLTSCKSSQIADEGYWESNGTWHWAGIYTPFFTYYLSQGESISDAHNKAHSLVDYMDYDQNAVIAPDGADVNRPFGEIDPDFITNGSRLINDETQFFAQIMEGWTTHYLYSTIEPSEVVVDQLIAEVVQENPDVEPGSDAFNALLNDKIKQWKTEQLQTNTTRGRCISLVTATNEPATYFPGGMAASQYCRLFYVTDNANGRVLMYNPFERQHRRITLIDGLTHPADIDIGDSGRSMVYVTNGAVQRKFFGITAFITDTSGNPLSGAKVVVQSDLGEIIKIVDLDGYITVMDLLRPSLFSRSLFLTVYHDGGSQLFSLVLQTTDQTFVKLQYSGMPGVIPPPTYGSGTATPPTGPHFIPGTGDGDTTLPPEPAPALVTPGQTTLVPDIPISTSPPSTPPGGSTAAMPKIIILAPADDLVTAAAAHTLVGTVSDTSITSITLDINGVTQTIPVANKTFRQAITLTPGLNTLVASGINDKGIEAQSDPVMDTVDAAFTGDTGALTGRVMNGSGYPAQGIRIVEESTSNVTYTDINGTYRFTGIPVGRVTLRVLP